MLKFAANYIRESGTHEQTMQFAWLNNYVYRYLANHWKDDFLKSSSKIMNGKRVKAVRNTELIV